MDTLLPTQIIPRLPARATFVADTNFVSGTQKRFLILFRNILCPQQMFPSLRNMETQHSFFLSRAFACPRNIMSKNVSATMCTRLLACEQAPCEGRKKIRRAKCKSGSEASGSRSVNPRAKRVGRALPPHQTVLNSSRSP